MRYGLLVEVVAKQSPAFYALMTWISNFDIADYGEGGLPAFSADEAMISWLVRSV